MKPDSPTPAAHLVRYGVATARGAFRAYLRHYWMQTELAEEDSETFDEVVANPDTQFSLGKQPWAGVLARSLRRVARLFADEGLSQRFSKVPSAASVAPVLAAFGGICADMDAELETTGFEIQLGESEASVREKLIPHLPATPPGLGLGATRVWLPEFFAGMMNAAIWREIVAETETLKLAAESAAEFFKAFYKQTDTNEAPPSVSVLEQSILEFAPKTVEYGLGQISWTMEPEAGEDLQAKVLPYLRAAFSREVPPEPVVAQPVLPPTATDAPKASKSVLPPTPTDKPAKVSVKSEAPKPAASPTSASESSLDKPSIPLPSSTTVPPVTIVEEVPHLRKIPRNENPKVHKPMEPLIPDDDDDEVAPPRSFRGLRWFIGAAGLGLVIAAVIPFFGSGGGLGIGALSSSSGNVSPVPEPAIPGPERMVVLPADPLPEPAPVSAAPAVLPRLFEQAQTYIESARRAKRAGDNRQAAEDLSRAILIFKEEFGEQRWRDQRYLELRNEYRVQLGLLEFTNEHITLVEDLLGAREPVKQPEGSAPELSKMTAIFARGDEEVARGRPKAAAEAYELALRTGLEILKDDHLANRVYQQCLSRYIDFLISADLDPDEMHTRIALVKAGKKPGPLPEKKPEPESDGLGLPKLN